MPYSVALNQPVFDDQDFGGLGQWGAILTTLAQTAINVGGQFVGAKFNAANISAQIKAQTQAAKDIAAFNAQKAIEIEQVAAATPITSNPLFLPIIGGAALVLFLTLRK